MVVAMTRSFINSKKEIQEKIKILETREMTESVVNRIKFQKQLEAQVDESIKKLKEKVYFDTDDYIKEGYEDGFIGAMYDIHGQGIPLIFPINQEDILNAVNNDTKLSRNLYETMGFEMDQLIYDVNQEIARGVSMSASYIDIARQIDKKFGISQSRALTIARTEGHRVRIQSTYDAQVKAKDNGADVVKQWDATQDGKTRPNHKLLDGQIQEVYDDFVLPNGQTAQYPSGFGIAKEDINCRCALLQRARWALDESELKVLKERAEYYGLDKTKDFSDFKKKYLKSTEQMNTLKERINKIKNSAGAKPSEDDLKKAGKIFREDFEKELGKNPNSKKISELKQKNRECKVQYYEMDRKSSALANKKARAKYLSDEWEEYRVQYEEALQERARLHREWTETAKQLKTAKDTLFYENSKLLKTKLSEIRPMGSGSLNVSGHLNNSRSPMRKVVEEAYDVYPTSWIEKSVMKGNLTPKKVDRGYYSHWDQIIAISGDAGAQSYETAIHEIGHRFEKVVDGVLDAEKIFYDRRTAGEALEWLGAGYDRKEVTRFDQFIESYMGKDYKGTAYELVSMGFQLAYTDPDRLLADPDMAEWIFGLLTILD